MAGWLLNDEEIPVVRNRLPFRTRLRLTRWIQTFFRT